MHRYKRLIITAAVLVVLLLVLTFVQGRINSGFRSYLAKRYPNYKFSLSAPSIQLFPLRFEVNVYAPEDKVYFTSKAVFSFSKSVSELANTTAEKAATGANIQPFNFISNFFSPAVQAAEMPSAESASEATAEQVEGAITETAAELDMQVVKQEENVPLANDNDWQKYLPSQKELLQFHCIYSDNYLEQRQAQAVMQQVKPLLQDNKLIDRFSVDVSIKDHEQFINLSEKELTTARLMIRFNKQIRTKDDMLSNIKSIIEQLNSTGITDLDAVYFESAELTRNEEQFAELGVAAETWIKTSELAGSTADATAADGGEESTQATVVIASGYSNDFFYYCFNYNMDFMPVDETLINNGLRIKELHKESVERFRRTWNYNLNQ